MINQAKDLSDDIDTRIGEVLDIAKEVWLDRPTMAFVATTQAILESALNQSNISGLAEMNNLFGIKGEGTAGTSQMGTQEEINGRMITVRAGFAVNNTLRDSFMQHRELMYHHRYMDVLNARTADDAFEALQEAGYATDPSYSDKLKTIFNETFGDN